MVKTQDGIDYCGLDENSATMVEQGISAAYEYLERATGINWKGPDKHNVADETVKNYLWLYIYAARGEAANTDYIERHMRAAVIQLQYSPEVTAAEATNDS